MPTVFLSWSGNNSKHHARAWHTWISEFFKSARVFTSDSGIEAGADWRKKLAGEIRRSKVGIVFVTAENTRAPWILFEAGALAIAKRRRLIVCIVSGSAADLPSPLQAFNAVTADREGAKKIFRALKDDIGTPSARFSAAWPRLQDLVAGQ